MKNSEQCYILASPFTFDVSRFKKTCQMNKRHLTGHYNYKVYRLMPITAFLVVVLAVLK